MAVYILSYLSMKLTNLIPFIGILLMLLIVEAGAVLFAPLMKSAGITAFEDPTSLTDPVIFIVIMLAFTLFLLVLIRYNHLKLISAVIGLSIWLTFVYIFQALVFPLLSDPLLGIGLAVILGALASLLLYRYPEWYVIDGLGLLLGAGVAAIFGVSLGLLPVLLLLLLLAVYDAISVYRTKHMIALAEGVIGLKTPILFVVPKKRDYSFIRDGVGDLGGDGERGAFIIGMGDLIMPSILVVSAAVFLPVTLPLGLNLPALGAMAGSVVGLAVLLWFVNTGKPQAGLPPLNGGTIIGFLLGCAAAGTWSWLTLL
jgi:presenilin-like A22 family membrane protease